MKKSLKKLLIITLYIGLIFISTKVYATSVGTTINDTTRIREKASTDSSTVALLNENTEVTVHSKEDGWYKVTYKKYEGYIREDLLKLKEEVKETENKQEETTNTETTSTENTESENKTEQKTETVSEQAEESNVEVLQKGYQGTLSVSVGVKILPTINSSVIVTLPENTKFTVLDVMNKWGYIETESYSGWVLLSKLSGNSKLESGSKQEDKESSAEEKEEEKQEEKQEETKKEEAKTEETKTVTKYVSTETLNVREKPENNANIITQITLNTQVTVVEEVDSTWSKVKLKNTTGYVASKYLSDKKTEKTSRSEAQERNTSENNTETSTSSEKAKTKKTTNTESNSSSSSGTTGSAVVAYAKQFLGYKYVSGGSSPSTGFDCSGFTSYVYKHFGYTLNRVSKDQINNGTAVSKSELKVGDIVLFKGSSGSAIGHVGIYIGGNMFIHAANPSKGVVTTSLSDSYYAQRYVAARRIIN